MKIFPNIKYDENKERFWKKSFYSLFYYIYFNNLYFNLNKAFNGFRFYRKQIYNANIKSITT